MAASLILLIAARSMMSCSTRLKSTPGIGILPHTMTGHMMHQVPMRHTPQMQVAKSPEDKLVGLNLDDVISGWQADTRISHQSFPPTTVFGMDSRQVLNDWADKLISEEHSSPSMSETDGSPPLPETAYYQRDKATVLHKMLDEITHATSISTDLDTPSANAQLSTLGRVDLLEMVGLVPKNFAIPFNESVSSAVDPAVMALGVFTRGKVTDDSRGSLRNKMEENGNHWTRALAPDLSGWDQFDAFAIQGLVDAPGVDEQSVRVLLSKIAKYAQKEQMIVIVPSRQGYLSSDGSDLTEYYVRLGFEKVEMERRLHVLVYTGASSSAEDMAVEDQQIMVGTWRGHGNPRMARYLARTLSA